MALSLDRVAWPTAVTLINVDATSAGFIRWRVVLLGILYEACLGCSLNF